MPFQAKIWDGGADSRKNFFLFLPSGLQNYNAMPKQNIKHKTIYIYDILCYISKYRSLKNWNDCRSEQE